MTTCSNNERKWIDKRVNTPLNACSLEVFQRGFPSNNENGEQKDYHPLVIGCYELCESNIPSNPEEDQDDLENNECTNLEEDVENENVTPATNSRNGALLLHMIPSSRNDPDEKPLQFGKCDHELHTSSGILDGKWYQRSSIHMSTPEEKEGFLYATACASGAIELYNLQSCETEETGTSLSSGWKLNLIASSQDCEDYGDVNDEDGLALSLAFDESMDLNSTLSTRIVSSYSKGKLALHKINISPFFNTFANDEERHPIIERPLSWDAHKLFGFPAEVWTTCFATNQNYATYSDVVISGGDDCKMKLWDVRTLSSSSNNRPIHCIGEEEFGAGVTAVTYHPFMEHIFCSGSYDEYIRLWDMRKMNSKEPLCSLHVGGGVWRVKWHPTDNGRILVGAMHGGCRAVDVPVLRSQTCLSENSDECDLKWHMTIEKEFLEHKSMAYGADWIHRKDSHEAAASCSFYDRQAFIWSTQ